VRRPKDPPPLSRVWERLDPNLFGRSIDPVVREAVDRANDLGWNYEQCGYRKPLDLSRDDFWALVKLSRMTNRKTVPLVDAIGRAFTYRLPAAADRILHLADKEMAGTIVSPTTEFDSNESRARYLVRSLTEEAIASSQIEGAAVTREDAKRMLREKRPPRTEGERMVLNNYATIRMLNDRRAEPMTPELLCEIQHSLTDGTLKKPDQAGRFRRPDEKIRIWDDQDNEVVYVPPPAAELPTRVAALCEFANGRDDPAKPGLFIHPVVRAVVCHFWLGFDHPFADGNGRTARALFYWHMLRNGYWLAEYLTISEIIRHAPVQYARAYLNTEGDDNDLTYFILYHLTVLERSLREFHGYLARKAAERANITNAVSLARFTPRQREVLMRALRDPAALSTYESHAETFRVTVPTARADLLDLTELGLLRQNKSGRRFEFTPVPDLARRLREMAARPD